jgi:lipoprotein-releasing system permease protein
MLNSLRYFIAGRYIRSRNSHSMINHISRVSIVAMAMPVAAIIVLLSVFNGLESKVRTLYHAIDADITVSAAEGTTFLIDSAKIEALRQMEGVASLSLTLEQGAMAESKGRRSIVRLKGVDTLYNQTIPLRQQILSGEMLTQRNGKDYVVASIGVLQELGMGQGSIGNDVSIYTINRNRFSTLLPVGGYSRLDAPIMGVFALDENNNSLLLTSLSAAQRLLNYPDRASTIELRLDDEREASALATRIETLLGDEMRVLTRYESNSIYRLMALEKWGIFAVAALVMAIASMSIVGTLIMVIIDKQDDIATLRTLGLTPRSIRQIFTAEGYLMTLISLGIGLTIGLLLTLAQQHLGLIRLNATAIGIDAYPVELHWGDVVATIAAYAAVAVTMVNLTIRAMVSK